MQNNARLEYLDGLRGIAAAWVVVGHILILTWSYIPIVSNPIYAVDLFMIISGLLMYYHAASRSQTEPFDNLRTWSSFWMRRFFRIAPVYYCALIPAFLLGAEFGEWRHQIAIVFPGTATSVDRYFDPSFANVFAHVSFLFGLSPYYHFRTVLPDWSIGLEMQFYFAFPIIFLAMMRLGPALIAAILLFLAVAAWVFFGDFMKSFLLPAFLPLKINLFLSGMIICAALSCKQRHLVYYCLGALVLAVLPLNDVFALKPVAIRFSLAAIVLVFATHSRFNLHWAVASPLKWISARLGRGIFFWMGELSYSVYLIHLMIVVPVAGYIAVKFGASSHTWVRAGLCFLIAAPISYGLAWFSLFLIERPGIGFGRQLIKQFKSKPGVTATAAPVQAGD